MVATEAGRPVRGAGAPVWTVPVFLPYTVPGPLDGEVCKVGVDNPAYAYDTEVQSPPSDNPSSTPVKLKKQPWLRFWELRFQDVNSPRIPRRTLALMISVILVLLIVVMGTCLILYLTVGGQQWQETEEEKTDEEGSSTVDGEFRVINRVYHDDLRDARSPSFIRLAAEVLQAMDDVFLQSPLVKDYNTSEIVAFQPGSVIVKCRIFLNRQYSNSAQHIGLTFIQALEHGHGVLTAGNLHVDIRSIRFSGVRGPSPIHDTSPASNAAWSSWSEWSPCSQNDGKCDPSRVQSRSRRCRENHGAGPLMPTSAPCQQHNAQELEIRDCQCISSPPNVDADSQGRPCTDCYSMEICLVPVHVSTGHCVMPLDPNDPRGCGGWCSGEHELCRNLSNRTFQCVDDSECLLGEWRCGNGLCIPQQRRCDGHFNCYDMTDEQDCKCKFEEFHCGNETSCLPNSYRCNGFIDCWDGSDEMNCTVLCPESQYTCNSGQCIAKDNFCDSYPDCQDKSDEPEGCLAPCLPSQFQCSNGRCVHNFTLCDGKDHCGDNSDEEICIKSLLGVTYRSLKLHAPTAETSTNSSYNQSHYAQNNTPYILKES